MRGMASGCWFRPNTPASSFLAAVVIALSLFAFVDCCKVAIVSPTSGSVREEALPFSVSFRVRSSLNAPCQSAAAVDFSIDGKSVMSLVSESNSFLPIAFTSAALMCCNHVIELCVKNVPESCARAAISISRLQQPLHWMPSTSGQPVSNSFVAHSDLLADALNELFLPHDPLLDMSCDKFLLAHRGNRQSKSGDALTLSYDYSRQPLSQFEHCVAECTILLRIFFCIF